MLFSFKFMVYMNCDLIKSLKINLNFFLFIWRNMAMCFFILSIFPSYLYSLFCYFALKNHTFLTFLSQKYYTNIIFTHMKDVNDQLKLIIFWI